MNEKGAQLIVDLKKISENFLYMAAQAPQSIPAVVLKSNAYGIGLVPVAETLISQGAHHIFVSTLEEAITLRTLYPNIALYLLNGPWIYSLDILEENNIIPVLLDREDINRWHDQAKRKGKILPAILQVDVGMGRFGLNLKEAEDLALHLKELPYLRFEFLLGHLSSASNPNCPTNEKERLKFETFQALFPGIKSTLANSAGILLGKSYHYDMVRMAIALYGGFPLEKGTNPLHQTVTLQGRIIQIRSLEKGEKIGYDGLYTMPKKGRIATLNMGFADGLPRSLSNVGFAVIQGFKIPIAGRISMDWVSLDVTHVPEHLLTVGQWATFIGDEIPVDNMASLASTTSYDILSRLSTRIERIYIPPLNN